QQILVAGHETTASLISLMLYRLIEDPALFQTLRERPELLEPAVEEFLRFDSPVQGLFRSSREACRLGDAELPPGTKVQVLFAAANRDPRIWTDPDVIDPERFAVGGRPHLAFGWGVHHCIGNALARHEARFALRAMLDTFAEIQLVGDVAVNFPFILRGLTTLPVRWQVHSPASAPRT
ncbi:MAG: cytochrome P450, partial [Ilumatobacteraceae bacterium]